MFSNGCLFISVCLIVLRIADGFYQTREVSEDSQSRAKCLDNHDNFFWFEDCNWCYCARGGEMECTDKDCSRIDNNLKQCGHTHAEGESWFEHNLCMSCLCSKQGPVCFKWERKYCVADSAQISVQKLCDTGRTWFDGCNWCTCTSEHTNSFICTQNHCKDGLLSNALISSSANLENPDVTPNSCVAGSIWQEDCRWCICFQNTPHCTSCASISDQNPDRDLGKNGSTFLKKLSDVTVLKRISRGVRTKRRHQGASTSCLGHEVGDRWGDGCNVCVCSNARVAMCTAIYCHVLYDKPNDDPTGN